MPKKHEYRIAKRNNNVTTKLAQWETPGILAGLKPATFCLQDAFM